MVDNVIIIVFLAYSLKIRQSDDFFNPLFAELFSFRNKATAREYYENEQLFWQQQQHTFHSVFFLVLTLNCKVHVFCEFEDIAYKTIGSNIQNVKHTIFYYRTVCLESASLYNETVMCIYRTFKAKRTFFCSPSSTKP